LRTFEQQALLLVDRQLQRDDHTESSLVQRATAEIVAVFEGIERGPIASDSIHEMETMLAGGVVTAE
jgi:hypothetical protein